MIPGAASAIDVIHARWAAAGVRVVQEPYDDVFGRTFVAADPDGNLIRVSPMD
jgi:predicted enzyme related to lactoylglutathione lyase